MGDVAEMMLEGTLCETCGVFIGDGDGYPRRCRSCKGEDHADAGRYVLELPEKNTGNRTNSTKLLRSKRVQFTSHNSGRHLIVTGPNGLIDFWPGTGKWIDRKQGRGRGVFNLVKHVRSKKP